MKKYSIISYLILAMILISCSTLGFGDFEGNRQKSSGSEEGVTFQYKDVSATKVSLAGDFNNWDAEADLMTKKGDTWSIKKKLDSGKYGYKFVVNGTDWKIDPENSNKAEDGFGGENSIIIVGSNEKKEINKSKKEGEIVFEYIDNNATSVSLAGDFNNWDATVNPMKKKNKIWTISLKLDDGKYAYKFVVNGEDWKIDPSNDEKIDDGLGGENSVIIVGKTQNLKKILKKKIKSGSIPVKFVYQPLIGGKHDVYLAGDFNSFDAMSIPMEENSGVYEKTLVLEPGKYAYKFVVDGNWLTDENATEFVSDGFGGQNSLVYAGDPKAINKLRKVEFSYEPQNPIKEVYLAGSLNDWNQKANRLWKNDKGIYTTTLLLKPGEYLYKFVVDGTQWLTDENAESFAEDGFGGSNSVILVDDKYPDVTIEVKDGIILDYGIPMSQSLETVNPLSPTKIQFKTKAHIGDVENIYLWKNGKKILMQNISEDGSFAYYQKIIDLKSKNEAFDYCFVYEDGGKEFYLLNGKMTAKLDKEYLFHYSKENVDPFFTPDWVKTGIIYQIFMDRFFNGDKKNDQDFKEWYYTGIHTPPKAGKKFEKYTQYFHLVDDWYDVSGLTKSPYHHKNKDGFQPEYNSFYGGDVAGVRQKLDYLEDLGITIIYFNPLFEAKSNHKYDAVDYKKLDPHFGDEKEFKAFVKDVHQRGIRIILDVAFNHTGETFWAFQEGKKNGSKSEYYNWYEWKKWPIPDPLPANYKPIDYYECWWGFGEMPDLDFDKTRSSSSENGIKNIEDANPNWNVVNYILEVADYWIGDMDLDGFRLDVPNEVPFWFWKLFRERVKSIKPDAYLVGEIWSNAVDWVNNDYFDSVMNYAFFKDPVMRFFNSRNCSAKAFDRDLKPGLLLYPKQASQVMMNLIDSHDTHRYLESAGGDVNRLKLAALFQMTYVGAPHIWYGDEIGMMGAHDPDCRRPFNWKYENDRESVSLRNYYKKLINIRKNHKSLSLGSFKTLLTRGKIYAYQRTLDGENIIVVINNEESSQTIKIPVDFPDGNLKGLLLRRSFDIKNGYLEVKLDGMSAAILIK
ncbi:MAG: alpha-glucosidase C-terminal domain-containing protein [Candidatus Cloacimonetes bacterium]|nr:alpha-glucosidase C-terminal domain-containing protein [Candidatus Cloacimonadota bacterium]